MKLSTRNYFIETRKPDIYYALIIVRVNHKNKFVLSETKKKKKNFDWSIAAAFSHSKSLYLPTFSQII